MKRILSPFIVLLTIFISSSVFGEEVKDVGLICKNDNDVIERIAGYWFKGNKTLDYYIRDSSDLDKDGNKLEFINFEKLSDTMSYVSHEQVIRINFLRKDRTTNPETYVEIDRFSLKMEENYFGKKYSLLCDLYPSELSFLSELKNIENSLRKLLKKRKI